MHVVNQAVRVPYKGGIVSDPAKKKSSNVQVRALKWNSKRRHSAQVGRSALSLETEQKKSNKEGKKKKYQRT